MKYIDAQQSLQFPLSIGELKSDSCRYVINDGNPTFMFCGKPKVAASYCADHYRLCYIAGSAPVFRKSKTGGKNGR